MRNIFIVIDNITNRNGTERAVVNLANMLSDSQKYKVGIISVKAASGEAGFLLNNDISLFFLGIKFSGNAIKHVFLYLKALRKIKEIIDRENGQIVIGTESGFNYTLPLLNRNIKTIGCEHFGWKKSFFHHKLLRRIIYPKLNRVVLLTEKDLKHYSFLSNAVCILNSISFHTTEEACFKNKKIIAVGRYTYQKGFDLLVSASVELKKRIPDYKIFIYGSGEKKKKLEEKIKYFSLQDYVFLKEPVQNISDVYKSSSIYVMTSRFEGLPMVLIEAQSFGIPIVSFDCPEGPSDVIINGENGYLIEEGNVQKFADTVIALAKNEKEWERMHRRSIELNARFSTENIFNKWNELLSEL